MTTSLQAVNTLLAVIGESPVNSIDEGHASAVMAQNTLEEVRSAVGVQGWDWNTEKRTLTPNAAGNLVAPSGVLRATFNRDATTDRFTLRGGKVYNLTLGTAVFTSPMDLEVIVDLAWDDLPEEARRYITIRSSRLFGDRVVGDPAMHGYTQEEEYQALSALWKGETSGTYRTIFDNRDMFWATHRSEGGI